MTDDSNLKSGSTGLTRRSALLAGVGLAAAGTFFDAASKTARAQDTSAFYPPVTPGIEPRGARVQPYPAACVQSGVVPTFDSSGNFLPEGLERNVDAMCELIRRGADEHGARLMSFPEFGLQVSRCRHVFAEFLAGCAGHAFGLFGFHAGLPKGVRELQRVYHGLAHGVPPPEHSECVR